MILAAVDDFLFRSKIRTVAKQAGIEVTFVQSMDETVAQARSLAPSLVILDLNSTRVDPIATLTTLKSDPQLAPLRTLGFVSHVQTEVIDAARAAGADVVMARSAFAAQLADILRAAG